MLNLLNREKRHFLRKEYFGRFFVVLLSMIIFVLVYYGVLLFSNSFLIKFEKAAAENEASALANSTVQKELTEYEQKLKHIRTEYNLFAKDVTYSSGVIAKITDLEMAGITISSINYQKPTETDIIKLEVKGVAKNRDVLLNYSNALKAYNFFEDVSVPF